MITSHDGLYSSAIKVQTQIFSAASCGKSSPLPLPMATTREDTYVPTHTDFTVHFHPGEYKSYLRSRSVSFCYIWTTSEHINNKNPGI